MDSKDRRIKELEKVAMELFDLVHESDLIHNKIRANDLYDIIKSPNVCKCGREEINKLSGICERCWEDLYSGEVD